MGTPVVLQSFQAALHTQWSWMLQLCCCIEAHLKENTAYFQVRTAHAQLSSSAPRSPGTSAAEAAPPSLCSLAPEPAAGPSQACPALASSAGPGLTFLLLQFFADVREAEEQLRKLQDTLHRKYTCDRSITVTRLEDLLQDAQVSRLPKAPAGVGVGVAAAGLRDRVAQERQAVWGGRISALEGPFAGGRQ